MRSLLPNVLKRGLDVVFCGMAAGSGSAESGAYYAGKGNKFWKILHQTGMTPQEFEPYQYRDVLNFGIGLTILAKHVTSESLRRGNVDVEGTKECLRPKRPKVLAFNGKGAAACWICGHPKKSKGINYGGRQDPQEVVSQLFILPSTAGSGDRYWDEGHWYDLATFLADNR